jgi:hypothetical protein
MWIKFFTDMAMDAYIDAQNKGYTPEQLKAMVADEEARKKTLDAAWDQLKANAGV